MTKVKDGWKERYGKTITVLVTVNRLPDRNNMVD